MDEDKWISVLITAFIGSVVVCLLILVINSTDKRGQALTWLPASLAATLAVTYMNSPDELPRLLETAFSSILISGTFIFSFFGILDVILPGETDKNMEKWHQIESRINKAKNVSKQRDIELEIYKERQITNSTLLGFVIVLSLLSKCYICLLNIRCNFSIPIFMQQIFVFLLNNSLNFYQNEISSYR